MRVANGRELSCLQDWKEFVMHHDSLELPTRQSLTAQKVSAGMALLEIQTLAKLLRFVRCIERIKRK